MIFVAGFVLQNGVIPFLPPLSQEENIFAHILYYARQKELNACLW